MGQVLVSLNLWETQLILGQNRFALTGIEMHDIYLLSITFYLFVPLEIRRQLWGRASGNSRTFLHDRGKASEFRNSTGPEIKNHGGS